MLYELLKEDDDINHREISYINTQENNDNKQSKIISQRLIMSEN